LILREGPGSGRFGLILNAFDLANQTAEGGRDYPEGSALQRRSNARKPELREQSLTHRPSEVPASPESPQKERERRLKQQSDTPPQDDRSPPRDNRQRRGQQRQTVGKLYNWLKRPGAGAILRRPSNLFVKAIGSKKRSIVA
jgi:hypothetical protein